MRKAIKTINITTVVASFIVPIVFIFGSFTSVYQHHSNTIGGIIYMLLCVLLTTVGFWGSLIQGIRSISSGKSGTIISAAVFQLIMYVMHMTNSVLETYYLRRSSDSTMRKFFWIFDVVLALMLVINVIKIIMARKSGSDDGQAAAGSPKTARKILVRFVILPVVYIALVIGVSFYLKAHPGVGRTIAFVIALVIVLAAFLFYIFVIEGHSVMFKQNNIAASESRSSGEEDKIVYELDRRYEKEYRHITGYYPWELDYKHIESVSASDQVMRLRRKMQIEAKEKGVYGKTKWF
ncbi:hypothetical protein SAMN02910456_02249 [Ruminococcaceae bacterium YRB3002]|nr:hypothetical protein SAMN02910456_02249 [Ruminococcaceae bacterium YRB3002]